MLYLGVDAGGTSTRAVLASGDGRLLGVGRSDAANSNTRGKISSQRSIQKAIHQALRQAHPNQTHSKVLNKPLKNHLKNQLPISPLNSSVKSQILATTPYRFAAICLGSATLQFQGSRSQAKFLLGHYTAKQLDYESDAYTAWAGAHCRQPGIVVISGTGSAVLGVNQFDQRINLGGWGPYYGDEGSSHWIGARAVQIACQTLDSRVEKKSHELVLPIMSQLLNYWNIDPKSDFEKIFQSIVARLFSPDRIKEVAGIARVIYGLAQSGDAMAQQILKEAATQLAQQALAGLRKMLFLTKPSAFQTSQSPTPKTLERLLEHESELSSFSQKIPISYSGSTLLKNQLVQKEFLKILKRKNIKVIEPIFPQSLGALLIAFHHHHPDFNSPSYKRIIENLKRSLKEKGNYDLD